MVDGGLAGPSGCCPRGSVEFVRYTESSDVSTWDDPAEPARDRSTADVDALSAGCNVQFHVELAYLGWEPLDPHGEWNLTYEIEGGEDIYINTLSIHGEQYSTDQTERISTPSSDSELTAVITRLASR